MYICFVIKLIVSNATNNGDISVSTTIFEIILIYFVEFVRLRYMLYISRINKIRITYPTENFQTKNTISHRLGHTVYLIA